ncbi:patatin-like phospholipase family protein [Amorphus sp. MBR-141]
MTDWIASAETGFFKPGELTKYDRRAVGFALSGGGYRATLFHAGAILRLNELGILSRIDRISSVSGGSIAAGLLAKSWASLRFEDGIAVNLRETFIASVLEMTAQSIDVRVSIAGFVPFISAGNHLAALYNDKAFHDMRLGDLPDRPTFVFNATNLQTGGLIRFTKHYIADWRALFAANPKVLVAEAVAASSAFPPVLAPMRLDLSHETVTVPPGARFESEELRKRPILVDGGVYDNLGLEPIWKRCGVLIASYAGYNSDAEPINFNFDHMVPVIMTFLGASIDWRERMLINLFQHTLSDGLPERLGTYWTVGTVMSDFPIYDGWKPKAAELAWAARTPTRLEALSADEQRIVVEAGYAYADAGTRSRLLPNAPPPAGRPQFQ